MKTIITFYHLYIIVLMFLLMVMFLRNSTCGVCFIGFLLINARLNDLKMGEEGEHFI